VCVRQAQAETLQRRMFYVPSFKIYGSVAGFYDYGPPGCAVKQNLTALWRKHFILEENMLEARRRRPRGRHARSRWRAQPACPCALACLPGTAAAPRVAQPHACCMHAAGA
jgi:hypothetical protein